MKLKARRLSAVGVAILGIVLWLIVNPASYDEIFTRVENTGAESGLISDGEVTDSGNMADGGVVSGEESNGEGITLAAEILEKLEVKGRAPKTGYSREQFYDGWPNIDGCSLRQRIIKRELGDTAVLDGCNVVAGEYDEPYTGKHIVFHERSEVSEIQIDHVVALSDAWQKGAQR